MAGPVSLRSAVPDDADGLAAVQVGSWRSVYAGLLPADFLAGLDVGTRAERWREILAAGSSTTVVAVAAGRIVGFCAVGPPLDPDTDGDTGALYALYVESSSWRTGVGHALHGAGLQMLREAGYRSAGLWVLRGNQRAIDFYESHGWRPDGRTQIDRHLDEVVLHEIGFSRSLRPPVR